MESHTFRRPAPGGAPSSTRLVRTLVAVAALASSSCLRPPPPDSAEAQGGSALATGSVESEPYAWKSVVIMGGGFVTGLLYSPVQAGILYARTDIGGAYRHDTANGSWIPLTDFLSHAQANYKGIESFAADPVRADRIYMAVGTYTAEWAELGAFMRSDDRGDTWKIFPAPFKMGGNDLSRSNGERLAIDPHQPNVLYFGSRRNGLWKSADEAQTWKKLENFPVKDDTEKGLGLVFVLFDPTSGEAGKPTPAIYVGSQVDGKVYRSKDAGQTWEAVPNQPATGFLPRRAAFDGDGTLYVTYALGDSPYALTNGAVHRFEPKEEKWTDITPLAPSNDDVFGYGGIAVDPAKSGTIVTTTMDRWAKGAEVFRSTDRGKTWTPLMKTAVLDGGGAKHVYHHRETLGPPQWMGDVKIDPFDSNRAMTIDGGGVWATADLAVADAGQPTHWSFHSKNLEETVARDVVSPPEGAPLLSVMLDTCGFRHDDLDTSPQRGTFHNPMCASGDDIDFAAKQPNLVVRTGTFPWDGTKAPRGAISVDGAASWTPFRSEPPGSGGAGNIAVSADGATIVWAPRGARVAHSKDAGATWLGCRGLPEPKPAPDWASWYLKLASDRVNPKKFYAFDALAGIVYASEDGGVTFEVASDELKEIPDYELQYAGIQTVPGREGELWITTKSELARSTDSGRTFSNVGGVEEAHAVGFGRAAPGQDHPAVYLSGKVGGITGFFRSDDAGDSFVRINDDAHQYGGAHLIAGDARVYGRVYVAPPGRGILYGEPRAK